MPKWLLVLFVIAATSCTKEDPLLHITLRAQCIRCRVTYTDGDGVVHSDSLWGNVVYHWQDGEIVSVDTAMGDASWSITLRDGAEVHFSACRWDMDTALGPVTLTAFGDIRPLSVVGPPGRSCATLNAAVSRP